MTADSAAGSAQDMVGFSRAGLQFLQRDLSERESVSLFADASQRLSEKRKKKKKKERLAQRAVLLM